MIHVNLNSNLKIDFTEELRKSYGKICDTKKNWEIKIWTNKEKDKFMKANYSQYYLSFFKSLNQNKSNILFFIYIIRLVLMCCFVDIKTCVVFWGKF